eukprot:Clim_evm54s55 gene=Clim_evmTU54s55
MAESGVRAGQARQSAVANTTSTNPLTRKVEKLRSSNWETDPQFTSLLQYISTLPSDGEGPAAKRDVRGAIEKQAVDVNEGILEDFDGLMQTLKEMSTAAQDMREYCEAMKKRIDRTLTDTSALIRKTTELQNQSERQEGQTIVASRFLEFFVISEQEMDCIMNPEVEVTDELISALQSVRKVRQDSKLLRKGKYHQVSDDIIGVTDDLEQQAARKIEAYCIGVCSTMGDDPEIPPLMKKALVSVSEREKLLAKCFNAYASARYDSVYYGFIDALTRGDRSTRPIEIHSSDPVRYLGDMLAWVHQTIEGERDMLTALALAADEDQSPLRRIRKRSSQMGLDMSLAGQRYQNHINTPETFTHAASDVPRDADGRPILHISFTKDEDVLEARNRVLQSIAAGLARALRVRVDQILQSELSLVAIYKISHILNFYYGSIVSAAGEGGRFLDVVFELYVKSKERFQFELSSIVDNVMKDVDPPNMNLMPVNAVYDVLKTVNELLDQNDKSILPTKERDQEANEIVQAVVPRIIDASRYAASNLGPSDTAVYMLNCIHSIQSTLSLYDSAQKQTEKLQEMGKLYSRTLITEEVQAALAHGNVKNKVLRIEKRIQEGVQTPLASENDFNPSDVQLAGSALERCLAAGLSDRLQRILSSRLKQEVMGEIRQEVKSNYSILYRAVHDPANAYKVPERVLSRTPEQLADIL